MQKLFSIIIGIVILAGVLFFGGAFYIVNESEQVVITQFGKPVGDPVTTCLLYTSPSPRDDT